MKLKMNIVTISQLVSGISALNNFTLTPSDSIDQINRKTSLINSSVLPLINKKNQTDNKVIEELTINFVSLKNPTSRINTRNTESRLQNNDEDLVNSENNNNTSRSSDTGSSNHTNNSTSSGNLPERFDGNTPPEDDNSNVEENSSENEITIQEDDSVTTGLTVNVRYKKHPESCCEPERLLYLEFSPSTPKTFNSSVVKAIKIQGKSVNRDLISSLTMESDDSKIILPTSLYTVFAKSKNPSILDPSKIKFTMKYVPENDAIYIVIGDSSDNISLSTYENLVLIIAYNTYATTSILNSQENADTSYKYYTATISAPILTSENGTDSITESLAIANNNNAYSFINYKNIPSEENLQLFKIFNETSTSSTPTGISNEEYCKIQVASLIENAEKFIKNSFFQFSSKETKKNLGLSMECFFYKYFSFVSTSIICLYEVTKGENCDRISNIINNVCLSSQTPITMFLISSIILCTKYETQYCTVPIYKSILSMFDSFYEFNVSMQSSLSLLCKLYQVCPEEASSLKTEFSSCFKNVSGTSSVQQILDYSDDLCSKEESEESTSSANEESTTNTGKEDSKNKKTKNFFSRHKMSVSIVAIISIAVIAGIGYVVM